MKSNDLIRTLIEQVQQHISVAENLSKLDTNVLTFKTSPNSWNILECLEHLNLYGDYYLPEIARRIKLNKTKPELEFKSGILGKFFAESMLPKENQFKMITFRSKNPIHTQVNVQVIERFIAQQQMLIKLLNQSKDVNLNKVKTNTTLSTLLKLKLGDTFQFIINHNIRHIHQAEKIKNQVKR